MAYFMKRYPADYFKEINNEEVYNSRLSQLTNDTGDSYFAKKMLHIMIHPYKDDTSENHRSLIVGKSATVDIVYMKNQYGRLGFYVARNNSTLEEIPLTSVNVGRFSIYALETNPTNYMYNIETESTGSLGAINYLVGTAYTYRFDLTKPMVLIPFFSARVGSFDGAYYVGVRPQSTSTNNYNTTNVFIIDNKKYACCYSDGSSGYQYGQYMLYELRE